MTTYSWVISALDTAPSENGLTDVVKTIHWRFVGANETHTTDIYSTISLDTPESENFTAFESLTKEQVEAWLESKLNRSDLENSINQQLERLANPPIVSKSVPWSV